MYDGALWAADVAAALCAAVQVLGVAPVFGAA